MNSQAVEETKAEVLRETSLLFIRDLYKWYGTKLVLDNIDLAVHGGEICSIVGPSGCGKSTLLRLLLGEERPTEGEILIDGQPVGFPGPSRGIVYQKYTLYPHLTVLENVMRGPLFMENLLGRFVRKKEIKERAMQYLARVKLEGEAGKRPDQLSGGMQQRVAIAQALIMKPKILLMDEPFGALDPEVREVLQLFFLELWSEEKFTAFFVTHDLEEAIFVGTRVLVLSQFYEDDRGSGAKRGAKIVADYQLPRHALSPDVKKSAGFGELISDLHDTFNPARRRRVENFNLRHPDSFQTLSVEELRR